RTTRATQSGAGRLYYAYADALLRAGRPGEARDWFSRAVDADGDQETDADDRVAELDGVAFYEVEVEGEPEVSEDGPGRADGSAAAGAGGAGPEPPGTGPEDGGR